MTTTETSVTLRMPNVILWLLGIGGGAAGFGLGFLAKPLVQWILDAVGDAPGPLRVAAALPTVWAVPALTVVGLLAGVWLAATARQESLVLTVGTGGIGLRQDGADRYAPRDSIAAVFLDGKELVLLDGETKQITRNKASDLSKRELQAAFESYGYPWTGFGDPREPEFQRWTDSHPNLDEEANQLLRTRARALQDKQPGAAADLADRLQSIGVVLRDRDGTQQYRRIPPTG
ncbi:YqeB family protein [Saccharopolyspora spinosa]|uniref:DUF308 domain-containing protein n=1 Tax=Saccharopolyspora spinosa TaxID=60894 RepID=A0A2N3XR60_SACSN|nr:hypothetical protein [Saccharopolyspora spinosa]PKW13168.1 hypothetical protein A8926_0677 [Saccharopolyspora spinosa]